MLNQFAAAATHAPLQANEQLTVSAKTDSPPQRSFDNALQDAQQQQRPPENPNNSATTATDAPAKPRLEDLQKELSWQVKDLAPTNLTLNQMLPQLVDSRSRLGMIRDAIRHVNSPLSRTGLENQFSHIENEWYQLESLMQSKKSLSMGEMLGLQVRMYQMSEQLQILGKALEQATSGVKTLLTVNV